LKVYADTSVYGGAFDPEFQRASRAFFEQVEAGRFRLVASAIVLREVRGAPEEIRRLAGAMLAEGELVDVTAEAVTLQDAYIEAGIVGPASEADALQVACATVTGCQMIVSWNFRHIVHYQKIALYNAINIVQGYSEIRIHSPLEVIEHED